MIYTNHASLYKVIICVHDDKFANGKSLCKLRHHLNIPWENKAVKNIQYTDIIQTL